MNIKITTPEGVVYDKEADSATLPTETGEITVLQNHIPLVGVLVPGEIVIKSAGNEEYLSVSTGFIEVRKNRLTILADTAESVESLLEEEILKAKERAEKLLQEKRAVVDVSFAEAAAALERELARLKVYRRRKGAGKTLSLDQK
jgi:F-type H+-transporting ATPase subunit epsilon